MAHKGTLSAALAALSCFMFFVSPLSTPWQLSKTFSPARVASSTASKAEQTAANQSSQPQQKEALRQSEVRYSVSPFRGRRMYNPFPGQMYNQLPQQETNIDATSGNGSDYLSAMLDQGLNRWTPDRFPVKVYFEEGSQVPGYQSWFKEAVVDGFNQWCKVSNGKLSWREVGEKRGADLVVFWTDAAHERSQGTEAGLTKVNTLLDTQTNQGIIKNGSIRLLTRPEDREFTTEEVRKAYVHECGHAFGLSGHSPYRNDIMYAIVNNSQPLTLGPRDINSINKLYSDYPAIARNGQEQYQSAGAVVK